MFEKKVTAWLADIAIFKRPFVFAAFALLTLAGILLSRNLGIVADPEDLIGADNPVGVQYFEMTEAFGFTSTLIVAVEGSDREAMTGAAHRVKDMIMADRELASYFDSINLENDPDYALKWGLMLAEDIDDISDVQKLLEQRSVQGLLTALNNTLEDVVLADDQQFTTYQDQWNGLASLAGFEKSVSVIRSALSGSTAVTDRLEADKAAEKLVESVFAGDRYSWSPEQDMLTFSMLPSFDLDDIESLYASVDGVDSIVRLVDTETEGISISLGGEVAWAVARHQGVGTDTLIPALIAMVLIIFLFFFSFTRMRKMVLAVIALTSGIIITVGAISLSVGHISFITSIFAVILLGLGIDFGIHLVSNYDDFRLQGFAPVEAMQKTMTASGAPILLGGITTAGAFLSLSFASSPAIREFGIVCGLGVIITLITMLLLFPALVMSFGGKEKELKRAKWRPMINFSFMGSLGKIIRDHPWTALILAALLTAVSVWAVPRNVIDYDPMNNSPRSHPYTKTQQRIIDRMEISPFISFSQRDNLEEARNLAESFRKERLVSMVRSAADFIPPEDEVEARLAAIAAGGPAGALSAGDLVFSDNPERTHRDVMALADEIQRLEWNVIELGDLAVAGMGEDNLVVRRRNIIVREIFGAETGSPGREIFQNAIKAVTQNPEKTASSLALLDASLSEAMTRQQSRMSVNRPPVIDDIPYDIRKQMVSADGSRFLITVIPSAETQAGSSMVMAFNSRLTEIDPGLTGSVPLYVGLIDEIFSEAAKAGVYVGTAVLLLLFIFFRNTKHVILAFLMVVLGIVWMFGLLPLSGTELALTAGLVFPLLIGIGTDDAMHILHRYRHEERQIVPALRYSGKAVLLTTATTMLAFGSLAAVGEMATIAAIGALLFIGLGTCFLATVIVLPALLSILDK